MPCRTHLHNKSNICLVNIIVGRQRVIRTHPIKKNHCALLQEQWMLVSYWKGKKLMYSGIIPILMLFYLPQIPHRLATAQTQAAAVRFWQSSTSVILRNEKWKHFSVQCSVIYESTLVFGKFPGFALFLFW